MPAVEKHAASYRDPSGFIFTHCNKLYRQVNLAYRQDYDLLMQSGLYRVLTHKKLLLPFTETDTNFTGDPEWYKTLEPETLEFVSYPYEWCFDMLKDAALLTLDIANEAMEHGMILKDASAFNVQWHQGRLVFIDHLSFETYQPSQPWIAYRQFCEHFLAPLALMHYMKAPLQQLQIGFPEGIPVSVARKMLPVRSRFNLHTYLHIHLQGKLSEKPGNSITRHAAGFSRQKMVHLMQSLRSCIQKFVLTEPSGVWSNYYEEANQRRDYVQPKNQIIEDFLEPLNTATAIDAGANEGEFSALLARRRIRTISADFDHYSVNRLYQTIKNTPADSNIHPLILDLSNPTPAIGVNNRERFSFLQRIHVDLVLALAVIHHLAIGKNIDFDKIAKMFAGMGRLLIIEWVPKSDEKIRLMLSAKKDIYDWYTLEEFVKTFSVYFDVMRQEEVASSGRMLLLMQRK